MESCNKILKWQGKFDRVVFKLDSFTFVKLNNYPTGVNVSVVGFVYRNDQWYPTIYGCYTRPFRYKNYESDRQITIRKIAGN